MQAAVSRVGGRECGLGNVPKVFIVLSLRSFDSSPSELGFDVGFKMDRADRASSRGVEKCRRPLARRARKDYGVGLKVEVTAARVLTLTR